MDDYEGKRRKLEWSEAYVTQWLLFCERRRVKFPWEQNGYQWQSSFPWMTVLSAGDDEQRRSSLCWWRWKAWWEGRGSQNLGIMLTPDDLVRETERQRLTHSSSSSFRFPWRQKQVKGKRRTHFRGHSPRDEDVEDEEVRGKKKQVDTKCSLCNNSSLNTRLSVRVNVISILCFMASSFLLFLCLFISKRRRTHKILGIIVFFFEVGLYSENQAQDYRSSLREKQGEKQKEREEPKRASLYNVQFILNWRSREKKSV